jgi:hypothetical protein
MDAKKKTNQPFAKDLRICDFAARTFPRMLLYLPLEDVFGKDIRKSIHEMKVDFSLAKAERDRQLLELRQIISLLAPALLKAAALPEVIPGVTDVPVPGAPNNDPNF